MKWSVYVIRCRLGTLYTGVATDVGRRFREHQAGAPRGAKYLRGRGPLRLVLRREIGARGLALRLERRIKALPKAQKEDVIRGGRLLARLVREVRAEGTALSRRRAVR